MCLTYRYALVSVMFDTIFRWLVVCTKNVSLFRPFLVSLFVNHSEVLACICATSSYSHFRFYILTNNVCSRNFCCCCWWCWYFTVLFLSLRLPIWVLAALQQSLLTSPHDTVPPLTTDHYNIYFKFLYAFSLILWLFVWRCSSFTVILFEHWN